MQSLLKQCICFFFAKYFRIVTVIMLTVKQHSKKCRHELSDYRKEEFKSNTVNAVQDVNWQAIMQRGRMAGIGIAYNRLLLCKGSIFKRRIENYSC